MAKKTMNPWMFWGEIVIDVMVVIIDVLKNNKPRRR